MLANRDPAPNQVSNARLQDQQDKDNPFEGLKQLGLQESKDYLEIAGRHLIPQGIQIMPPETVFALLGIPVFTKKSISTIIAKAKAGKTTFAAWVTGLMIMKDVNVLWIDTEQGLYYASRTQFWILQIADVPLSDNLQFYDLKTHPPDERIKIIEALIYSGEFDVIVIDGIRDLVFDINSPEEATLIATYLMKWAEESNIHLITILHQNKGNEHARGHLGTELMNKSETVIKVSQNDVSQIIIEPEFTRGKPFEVFALNRDGEGIPFKIEGWEPQPSEGNKRKSLLPGDIDISIHETVLKKVFTETSLSYGELVAGLSASFAVHAVSLGENKAKVFASFYLQEGLIEKTTLGRKSAYTLK